MTSFSLCFSNIGARHLEMGSLTPKAQVLVVAFKVYQGWQRPFSQSQPLPLWPPKAWEPESLLQMQLGGPLGPDLPKPWKTLPTMSYVLSRGTLGCGLPPMALAVWRHQAQITHQLTSYKLSLLLLELTQTPTFLLNSPGLSYPRSSGTGHIYSARIWPLT